MADVESHGGAAVYRFSEGSVRRAFDLGRTADQLHKWLAEHSRTPVPQPLTYLIDDVARRHGVLRIGTASTYLRCDDEDVLTQLLNSNLPGIRFRRLAPTVVVSPSPPDMVLSRLREAGLAPLAETFDGVVHVTGTATRRGEAPRRRTSRDFVDNPVDLTDDQVKAVIEKVRAGDRIAAERPADDGLIEPTAPAETIARPDQRRRGPHPHLDLVRRPQRQRLRTHRRTGPGRRRLAHRLRGRHRPTPHLRPPPHLHRPACPLTPSGTMEGRGDDGSCR